MHFAEQWRARIGDDCPDIADLNTMIRDGIQIRSGRTVWVRRAPRRYEQLYLLPDYLVCDRGIVIRVDDRCGAAVTVFGREKGDGNGGRIRRLQWDHTEADQVPAVVSAVSRHRRRDLERDEAERRGGVHAGPRPVAGEPTALPDGGRRSEPGEQSMEARAQVGEKVRHGQAAPGGSGGHALEGGGDPGRPEAPLGICGRNGGAHVRQGTDPVAGLGADLQTAPGARGLPGEEAETGPQGGLS